MAHFFNKIYNKISLITLGTFFLILFSLLNPGTTEAASFRFSPANATFIKGCDSRIDINISTQGINSNAADSIINYNPAGNYSISINNGNAFENYAGKSVSGDTITMTGFSTENILNTGSEEQLFGYIIVNSNGDPVNFNFDFTPGNTNDSNIADMDNASMDALTSVINGSYTFVDGFCETQAPWLTNISPPPDAVGVPLTTDVSFNIKDNSSGVDIDSVQVEITHNEQTIIYTKNGTDPYTFTGDQLNYAILIDPIDEFLPELPIVVKVTARDFADNAMSRSFKFNHISCEALGCTGGILTQCQDGEDNDFDGKIDMDDPSCDDEFDNNEYSFRIVECSDGIDNDNDGLIDGADPGCEGPDDGSEFNVPSLYACNDAKDNDGDGLIDLQDPDCLNIFDNSEETIPTDTSNSSFPTLTRKNIHGFIAERSIEIPLNEKTLTSLTGDQISFTISQEVLSRSQVEKITMSLNSNIYTFLLDNKLRQYTLDVVMPAPGNYSATIKVFYNNGTTAQLILPILSESYAKIFDRKTNKSISNAKITLINVSGQKELTWNSGDFRQTNPFTTSKLGEYAFVVPNGSYRLNISHPDYRDRNTYIFRVTNNIVNINLDLALPIKTLEDIPNFIASSVGQRIDDVQLTAKSNIVLVKELIINPTQTIKDIFKQQEQIEGNLGLVPFIPPFNIGLVLLYIYNLIFLPIHSAFYQIFLLLMLL